MEERYELQFVTGRSTPAKIEGVSTWTRWEVTPGVPMQRQVGVHTDLASIRGFRGHHPKDRIVVSCEDDAAFPDRRGEYTVEEVSRLLRQAGSPGVTVRPVVRDAIDGSEFPLESI